MAVDWEGYDVGVYCGRIWFANTGTGRVHDCCAAGYCVVVPAGFGAVVWAEVVAAAG